ncbi:MAG: HNH endonuclease [Verrucomicrobia bacterium]|nr:HNH endonuclease [Verrucomicrobiota bacterium]
MRYNTTTTNGAFDQATLRAVWNKGQVVPGYSPEVIRKDVCGKLMSWADYGKTSSNLGWEVDHIKPKAKGGGDELSNLQPLHWTNNRSKGDNYPNWSCAA